MDEKIDIKKSILDILEDGQVHAKKDIEDILISKKVIACKNADALRNALYILKNKGKIESLGKGNYRVKKEEELNMGIISDEEIDECIDKIRKDLKYLKTVNLMTCSEEVLKNTRNRAHKLDMLRQEIGKIIN